MDEKFKSKDDAFKSKKASFIFFLGLMLEMISSHLLAKELSLQDFLTQVQDANLAVQAANLRSESSQNRISPASTWDDPFFAAGLDQIPVSGGMGYVKRFQLSQTIPFPGKNTAKSNIAENKARTVKSDAETLNREIKVFATQTFYRLYYFQKSIELNESLKQLIENITTSSKIRYKTGEMSHHEWLLAKIELSVIEVEKLRLLNEQKSIIRMVNELRNQPPDTPPGNLFVQITDEKLESQETTTSLQDQPELKSLQFLIQQSENELNLADLSKYPDFIIQGMAMIPNSDMGEEKSNWGIMIGINIPIFYGSKQSKLATAANLEKEAAILEKRNIENRIQAEILNAKEQFKTAQSVATLYKNNVLPTTKLALDNARSGYASRQLPLSQYLELLKVQRVQELEYLAAQLDVELAKTRMKELLSSPPILRLSPSKPSLFGSGDMGADRMGSSALNMSPGTIGPTRKEGPSSSGTSSSSMGGM